LFYLHIILLSLIWDGFLLAIGSLSVNGFLLKLGSLLRRGFLS